MREGLPHKILIQGLKTADGQYNNRKKQVVIYEATNSIIMCGRFLSVRLQQAGRGEEAGAGIYRGE